MAKRPFGLLLRVGGFAVFDDVVLSTEERDDGWRFRGKTEAGNSERRTNTLSRTHTGTHTCPQQQHRGDDEQLSCLEVRTQTFHRWFIYTNIHECGRLEAIMCTSHVNRQHITVLQDSGWVVCLLQGSEVDRGARLTVPVRTYGLDLKSRGQRLD